jgi:ABC-2 type transport system ATP-binding protein
MSHHARLLVLDEPTSGRDPAARSELSSVIGDYLTDEWHSVVRRSG